MKLSIKFLSSDVIVVGIGTVVISTFSFLYYLDITKKVVTGNTEEVGTITFKRKIAQRKYSSQVVWEDIEQNVPVYNNDSVRTADMSEAVVHLKDGTEIALIENSMILLALSKDQIDIEFSHGSMLAKRGSAWGPGIKKLNIKSGGTTVSIEKSDVKLSHEKGKDLNLSISRGNAKISTKTDEKLVNEDQRVVVAKDSKDVKLYTLKLKLMSPKPNSYFVTSSKTKKINFSWESSKGKHDLFLEISKNSLFKDLLIKERVTRNSRTVELQKGTYYWRLRLIDRNTKKAEISDFRRLNILWDDPLHLIFPKNKSVFTYRTALPIINFKWSKSTSRR